MTLYAVTIFLSAFLLFQVQPMIGRYVLPWFGGGPAVWTDCMLFFRAWVDSAGAVVEPSAMLARAIRLVLLAITTLLSALASAVTVLFARVLLKEEVPVHGWAGLALVLVGLALLRVA